MFSCEVNYSGKRQLCYLLWYIFIHVIYLIARGRRGRDHMVVGFTANRGNNKITEHRAIFKRERQNSCQQTDKISQQPENWENRNGPDLVQAFPKKWWVESDFTSPNLPLSLRLKGSVKSRKLYEI